MSLFRIWSDDQLRTYLKVFIMASIVFAIATRSTIPLGVCLIAVGGIEWLRFSSQKEGFRTPTTKNPKKESTKKSGDTTLDRVPPPPSPTQYQAVDGRNPMGNVLLTDIGDTPDRPSAPPSFLPSVYKTIHNAAKQQTQVLNPDIPNVESKLYGGLYEQHQFDNTLMRNFYSNPSTRVASDQGAFAQWLYGDMPSSKQDSPEGALMRMRNTERYVLR